MKKLITLCFLLFGLFAHGIAQKLALEKTYEITGQAKRGYLDDVVYDATTKNTMLSFVTRETSNLSGSKSKVKYQNYYFDSEFTFLNMEEKIDEYRNKKYRGDNYQVEGVSMENNLTGAFVLRRKLTSYTWDWFFGGYKKKVKLLDKVKPKNDEGKNYSLIRKFENDETGEVIALVKRNGTGFNDKEFVILKINNQLEFTVTDKKTFEHPQVLAGGFLIEPAAAIQDGYADDEEDEDPGEVSEDAGDLSVNNAGIVFAPSQYGKKGGSTKHGYTFIRISAEGKILNTAVITTKASVWNINSAISAGESVYLFGPANDGKYFNEVITTFMGMRTDPDELKWKLFQMAKVTNDNVDYLTTTDLDEFEEKLKTPPSQKKTPSWRGKKFNFSMAHLHHDGSMIIAGQNYEMVRRKTHNVGVGGYSNIKSYRDVITFYFDASGVLKSQFGVRKGASYSSAVQFMNSGKSSIYWTLMETDGVRMEKEGKVRVAKDLIYPRVSKIDTASGDINDFVTFGTVKDKPKYFLHNRLPILPVADQNAILYFGTDKPGKVLWFGKLILE